MTLPSTRTVTLGLLCAAWPVGLKAQEPMTRAQAVAAALARGARAALGRADTAAARGLARSARAFPNPVLSTGYTKDAPQYHAILDLPLDLPWLRAPRIGAAESARAAARHGFAFERAAIRFEVDTTYTLTLSAQMHARLSRRTALDADSLLKVARLRRDAGDVSELDVRLAAVNAGQLENVAVDDSLAAVDALLALQLQAGLAGDEPVIALADSLVPPAESLETPTGAAEPLPVAAAAATLRSEERALAFAHRSIFAPSLECAARRAPRSREPGGSWGRRALVSSATRGCSPAPIESPRCPSRRMPRARLPWPMCSKLSATPARRWAATSTTSPPPMSRRRQCASSPPPRTSRETPRHGTRRLGRRLRRLGERG